MVHLPDANRREFLAIGSASVLAALMPATALARDKAFALQIAHLTGSQSWTPDDPRLQRLLMDGLVPSDALHHPARLSGPGLQGSVRVRIHTLSVPDEGLESVEMAWTAPWFHQGRFVAMSYRRDALDPLGLPLAFTVPVHPTEGLALSVSHQSVGHRQQVDEVRLGARGGPLLMGGVTIMSLRRPEGDALHVALIIEAIGPTGLV